MKWLSAFEFGGLRIGIVFFASPTGFRHVHLYAHSGIFRCTWSPASEDLLVDREFGLLFHKVL